ncbi:NAD(P)/FAD-dependent oxidoreductase [Calderihabitans maritimus]|uniref:NADH oxidase n=1 Tax=Calderihabitans maritimus TaxID=1246530 RepID=A0A1Z5HP01_9FIRM|nr:FAD-dependent oxidoreductase [Calderihabitans maritimus]GAW91051.1 NADH oxidase [Calderihabitans maritimus]
MRVVIVGGSSSAAVAARTIVQYRPGTRVDVFTKREVAGYRPCEITYVLSGEIPDFENIIQFDAKALEQNNIFYHFRTEVTHIDPDRKVILAGGKQYAYDALILATGSEPTVPPIPGRDGCNEFVLGTDIDYAFRLREAIPRYNSAIIVGAGAVGLEVAEALVQRNYEKVYVVEAEDHLLPKVLDKDMADILREKLEAEGITFIFGEIIKEIETVEGKKKITLGNGETIAADFIVFCTGFKPRVELAKQCGLEIGITGGIKVDQYLRTSKPDIFAIGDAVEIRDIIGDKPALCMLALNAVRTGKIAARNAVLDYPVPFNGTTFNFIMRIAGLYVGSVGYNQKKAAKEFAPQDLITVFHKGITKPFYLQGKPIFIKLLADARAHRLVGAQIISEETMPGDLDRLALSMTEQVPIERLSLSENCYTPAVNWPYGPLAQALDQLLFLLYQKNEK